MALKGNLRDFTVTQILNLINLAGKTGTLFIEGPSEKVSVSFKEGKLAYAHALQDDSSLVAVLHQANKLTAAQHRVIKERAGNISDKELGLLLINANYLSQNDILYSLQSYFVKVVKHLFTWAEGYFTFENDRLPPSDRITVRISLENLIIEGVRQMREWEQLQDEIPSLDMALKFADRPKTNIKNLNLSVEEWRVVSSVNPRNTIRQIGANAKLNDLEIRRIVYGLLQAGLVELIRPEVIKKIPVQTQIPVSAVKKEEHKSIINRIIDRIRSL